MTPAKPSTNPKTTALLWCGIIACPLFIVAFIAEGATRAGYSPLRYPISSLSLGDSGWMQMTNFIITGLLLLAFAAGVQRAIRPYMNTVWGPLLIGFVATGLTGAGICTTDPVFGYPAGKPLVLAQYTMHGHFHDGFSMLVFIGLPAACFVFRRQFIALKENGWAAYCAFTGYTFITAFILTSLGFKQVPCFVAVAGALQRLTIIIGWAWMMLLGLHLLRTARGAGR